MANHSDYSYELCTAYSNFAYQGRITSDSALSEVQKSANLLYTYCLLQLLTKYRAPKTLKLHQYFKFS